MSEVTNADVQKKCPAFIGGGCPYSNLPQHKKGIAVKCPEFAKGGCPFATCKSVGEFQDKLSQMRDQCKGADAYQELLKLVMLTSQQKEVELGHGCPFFSKGCPFAHGKDILTPPSAVAPLSVSHCDLKAKCPAFKAGAGCPYSALPQQMKGVVGKCPGFENGCPWKNCTTVGEYLEIMAKMRDHCRGPNSKAAQQKFFNKVMQFSKAGQQKLGVCPFNKRGMCQLSHDAHGKPIIPK